MIPIAFLLGMALALLLYRWLGNAVVIVLAGATLVLILIGAGSDAAQYLHDRKVARRRWWQMRDNDALNRILGRRRA